LGGIFVSYRRSDSQGEAGRLFDDLVNHFGEHSVFMDVSAIEAGRDFRKAIEEGVTKCGVLLVVVGREWLEAKDERGARRLDDPSDFVRIETVSALKRDIPVIPVLVRGAKMPPAEQLPEELKELAYRNSIELTHVRWRSDIQLLIEALRRLLGNTSEAATNARRSETTASAPPGTWLQEGTASSKLPEGTSSRIDPQALQRVSRELALSIGPIAGIVVKRAASHCNSLEELYLKVAEEIDSREEREKFLLGRSVSPSSPPSKLAETGARADRATEASQLSSSSEGRDGPLKPASAGAEVPSANRGKYLLFASVAGVFLIVMLIFATRFAPSKRPSSSQTGQPVGQETHTADATPAKRSTPPPAETPATLAKPTQSSAPRVPQERERTAPKRVRVTEEKARSLLISTVKPDYPVLARQANIQGTVVLDANISTDGTVESLKLVSGHPLLVEAALQSAKQYRYKPYMENGEPVAMSTEIILKFALVSR
jgi:TonB family protein